MQNDLAAKANADKKSKTFKEMVPDWCRDFNNLFDKDNFDELPEPKTWDHAIELTPNANANLDCKVYPLNQNEQAELDKFLDENLSSGRIQPSKSPMASPFFFVKKKDGKLTSPGLLQAQRDDDQEPLPASPHLGANG